MFVGVVYAVLVERGFGALVADAVDLWMLWHGDLLCV
jgi:hypothetical protein